MRREHAAILLFFLILISTLTLGQIFVLESPSPADHREKTQPLIHSPLQSLHSRNQAEESQNNTERNNHQKNPSALEPPRDFPGFVPPRSDFRFVPTDVDTDCPVAVLPEDPELVCIKSPARSLPILPWKDYGYWQLIVWYRGKYYIPIVTNDGDVHTVQGVNGEAVVDTTSPLVFSSPGESFSIPFYVSGPYLHINVSFAFTGNIVRVGERNGSVHLEYRVPPFATREEIHPTGYYPFFVTVDTGNRTYALLSWVAFLKKPVVEITNYSKKLAGNGDLPVEVSGRVYYPDGMPVPMGRVWVTVNRSKGTKGFIIGYGKVSNGRFTVRGVVTSSIPPGSYHIIAHYRGYPAAPSNSDPELLIRRRPEIEASLRNDTLIIRVHWRSVPLANRSLTVTVGNSTFTLRTDERGFARLHPIPAGGKKILISYPGDRLYLPVEKTVVLSRGGENGLKISVNRTILTQVSIGLSLVLLLVLVVTGRSRLHLNPGLKLSPPSLKYSKTSVQFIEPRRRVFLPDEIVPVVLSEKAELTVDGKNLGADERFELRLPPGRHLLRAGSEEIELHILPPKEAVVDLYEQHFLPFVRSLGIQTRERTPLEIAGALVRKGIAEEPVLTITRTLVLAKYSERPVGKDDFWRMVDSLEKLGVL
ncbi:carboxypeptidase-like regulatory domain-containing protein [Thermococcus sp.]|uniref:carboxypeptidase-like regulatory domain-containing protein n=1 Tax=Thermococcus sp. TaxID=35749 RepID=UPI002614496A|nr:carboxypeptidase-like regulatory domain-containing protein [Thermococcus sp.]